MLGSSSSSSSSTLSLPECRAGPRSRRRLVMDMVRHLLTMNDTTLSDFGTSTRKQQMMKNKLSDLKSVATCISSSNADDVRARL